MARDDESLLHKTETSAARLLRLLIRATEEDLRSMVMRGVAACVGAVVAALGLVGLIVVVIVLLWDSWIGVALAVATPMLLLLGGIGALMWADRERESLVVDLAERMRLMAVETFTPAALWRQAFGRKAGAEAGAAAAAAASRRDAADAGAHASGSATAATYAAASAATEHERYESESAAKFNARLADAIEAELARRTAGAKPASGAAAPKAAEPVAESPAAARPSTLPADLPAALAEVGGDPVKLTVGIAAEVMGLSPRSRLWLMAGVSASRALLADRARRAGGIADGVVPRDASASALAGHGASPAPVSELPVSELPASAIVAEGASAAAGVIAGGARVIERAADRVAGTAASVRAVAHAQADRADAKSEAAEAEAEAIRAAELPSR